MVDDHSILQTNKPKRSQENIPEKLPRCGDQSSPHVKHLSQSTLVKGRPVSTHIEEAKSYCIGKLGEELYEKVSFNWLLFYIRYIPFSSY